MRALGVLGALVVGMGTLTACDEGPGDDAGDLHVIRHDMAPDPIDDAEVGPPDMPTDGPVDGPLVESDGPVDGPPVEIDMTLDASPDMPSGCRQPDGVLPGDAAFDGRAWRIDLPVARGVDRTAPSCGEAIGLSAGAEVALRFVPEVDGPHVIAVSGRFSTLYLTTPCELALPPDADGCLLAGVPFGDLASRSARYVATAGQPFDVVADAPLGHRAGPVRIWVHPPAGEGGSCAPISDRGPRPACLAGLACDQDVCVHAGPPRIDDARAWSDGQSLRVVAASSGRDLVGSLWARAVDEEGAPFVQLRPTGVEAGAYSRRFRGYVEDPELAAVEWLEIEVINADGQLARTRVQVTSIEGLEAGAECDADGMRDVCAAGGACVDGRCEISRIGAWLTEAGAMNLDVQMAGVPPLQPELTAVIRSRLGEIETPWRPLPMRPIEVGRRWTARDLPVPPGGLEMRIHEPGLPPGLPALIVPEPQPVLGEGQRCDPDGIMNRCGPALACLLAEPASTCMAVDPPVIQALRGWAGAEAIGVKVTFDDPQDDVESYRFSVFDNDAEPRFESPIVAVPAGAIGVFEASLPARWGPEPGDLLRLTLIDATGRQSEAAEAELEAPVEVAENGPCDPLGARSVCRDDDTVCALVDAARFERCVLFEVECPERWAPFELTPPGQWPDNTSNGPDRTAGACGGAGSPEGVYALAAERDVRWRISVQPPGAAVYVRTHCRFALPGISELACARAPFEIDVEAGETYYVFVDGPGDGGRFTLLVDEVR